MTKKTYIYGLDLSLNSSGVCIFTNDGDFVEAITIDTNSEKESKLKLKIIGTTLLNLMKKYPPNYVVIEQGFTRYNPSSQALFRVQGVASFLFCDYDQIFYPASTIKKLVGGKGNMSKLEIYDAIKTKYPHVALKNFDESDAFAVVETHFLKRGLR